MLTHGAQKPNKSTCTRPRPVGAMLPVEEHGGHRLASPADAVWYLDEAGNIAEDTVYTTRGQRGREPMVRG
jgi:hypothetical protein